MNPDDDAFFNNRVNQIGPKAAFKEARDAGVFDREDAATKEAASHAERWFNGTKHLYEPDHAALIGKVIANGKRGLLSSDEINTHIGLLAGSIWQPWEPNTSPTLDVPDHLGDQFR